MNKKSKINALVSSSLVALVLTTVVNTGIVSAAPGKVTRTSGSDRYETASQVAKANWTSSNDVILVSGEGYADAVSASVLAKKLNAPILLTTAKTLSDNAKQALETLKPKNVYVIGGNASVSKEVRDTLKTSYNLIELSGANRYETNVAVANKLVELGVDPSNAIMVGGEGFSDALSVAPVAAAKGQILLLGMNDTNYIQATVKFVNDHKSNVTVVGTSYVINEDTYKAVSGKTRIDGGANRFDTNLKVLKAFKDDLKMDKVFSANASGNGYADALVASALAGKSAAPLVLMDTESSQDTANALDYVKANILATTDLQVVGGAGVVSENVISKINALVPQQTTTDPTKPTETMPKSNIDNINTLIPYKTIVIVSLDSTTPEKYNVTVNGVKGSPDATKDGKKVFVVVLDNTYTKEQLKTEVTVK